MQNYAKLYETMQNYENSTPISEQMCLFARACASNLASRNLPAVPDVPDVPAEMGPRALLRPPLLTRAGG